MQAQGSPVPLEAGRNGVLALTGWGIRMHVERGRLVVEESQAGVRYRGCFSRATCVIRRVVIRSTTGIVSLAALEWLDGIGAKVLHLDRGGRVLMASGDLGLDDPRLRRAQATAMGTERGAAIVRELLRRKFDGQLRVARRLEADGEVQATIRVASEALGGPREPADFLAVEAAAASAYWSAWRGVEPRWARKDAAQVPEHWRRFDARASKLTGHPRVATDPVNAVTNLLAALGESEARWACLAQGLDPGLGVLHRDLRARDSLALDLLEVIRPDYEGWLLDWLERRTLRLGDFVEGMRGQVSIAASLVPEIVGTSPVWGARVAPVVEWVAQALVAEGGVTVPTRLTQANRSAGRANIRGSARNQKGRPQAGPAVNRTCPYCGSMLAPRRQVCDACRPDEQADHVLLYVAAGQAALQEAQARGEYPGRTPDANRKRGGAVSRAIADAKAWERDHPDLWEPARFTGGILPGLQGLSAGQVARAVGISTGYASQILKGQRVPHPRLWQKLERVTRA